MLPFPPPRIRNKRLQFLTFSAVFIRCNKPNESTKLQNSRVLTHCLTKLGDIHSVCQIEADRDNSNKPSKQRTKSKSPTQSRRKLEKLKLGRLKKSVVGRYLKFLIDGKKVKALVFLPASIASSAACLLNSLCWFFPFSVDFASQYPSSSNLYQLVSPLISPKFLLSRSLFFSQTLCSQT